MTQFAGNRWDEIQATARNIAEATFTDPDRRNRLADELITLVTLVVEAVGKNVACEGEADTSDEDDETAFARYRTGEDMQEAARYVKANATEPTCGLDRWEPKPVWVAGSFWRSQSWELVPSNHHEVDDALDADGIYAKGYYTSVDGTTVVDGIKFGADPFKRQVARYGDIITRVAHGAWTVTKAEPAPAKVSHPNRANGDRPRCDYMIPAAERGTEYPAVCEQNEGHPLPHTG